MAEVLVAPAALADLEALIVRHSLPADTKARVRKALEPLQDFPQLGRQLEGRWTSFRFLLGPWSWMLLIYAYDERSDLVSVVTVQDARSAGAATSVRKRRKRRPSG